MSVFGGTPPGSGGHLDDALSAYLDDELAPAARREAEGHLAGCAECREELDDVAAARQAIRILPVHAAPRPLHGPAAVLPASAASRRRAAWALVAAVAAAIALVLPREPEVAPSLPSLADSHAARASIGGDPLTQLAPIAVPVRFGP
jgi:predicted anti-sigma-YlaC factor YlaD